MVRLKYQGRDVEGVPVDFRIEREDWNEYQLLDGSHLRLRLVLSEVLRLKDEFDAEGNPVYLTKSGNVVVVRGPDNLKKPKS